MAQSIPPTIQALVLLRESAHSAKSSWARSPKIWDLAGSSIYQNLVEARADMMEIITRRSVSNLLVPFTMPWGMLLALCETPTSRMRDWVVVWVGTMEQAQELLTKNKWKVRGAT